MTPSLLYGRWDTGDHFFCCHRTVGDERCSYFASGNGLRFAIILSISSDFVVFKPGEMNREIQILLIVTAGVSSFSSQNSTPVVGSEHLFKPIVIPNITRYFGQTTNATGAIEENLQRPDPTKLSDEESTVSENSVRFSSRYSTKGKDSSKDGELKSGESQEIEERTSFSDRSDEVDSSEEEDSNDPEEWKVEPTTNEPPTSFQKTPHRDFKNYEDTSSSEEVEEEEENNSEEDKKSVDVYHNSGSKNYHSVQTPLSNIRYRGAHSVREDFDSEAVRRPPIGYNWPYPRSQSVDTNEISDNSLEKGIREELEKKPRKTGLELAVGKDEKRKYNILKERERGKQRIEKLTAEEEKDHRGLPFKILKQYQVNEVPRYHPSKKTSPLITTPRNIFNNSPKQYNKLDISQEFEGQHFLGPVVFQKEKGKIAAKAHTKIANRVLAKGLRDQDKLNNERIQKTIFGKGSADFTSIGFNHLEESEGMYNAILANIQSVFGVRTNGGSNRSRQEESKHLTWTLPLEKSPEDV